MKCVDFHEEHNTTNASRAKSYLEFLNKMFDTNGPKNQKTNIN